ncbi:uncharacterized protein Z518_01488 [Rhinocladiella mackenziei CBS 650.93]|uniref:G1/S-specific cyclin pas1 n=1 Tax=Rhinocladiella mackenziei CBS 650.93 TaxID=1442369 RepID=A0A0D2J3W6_9EURO|nr:uncharacterized protein Z518_01488 [Rhinocladiella mackenziei CBS 650.93]KIX10406.1 hypothetical protein Z518_01488 [Rhinocladiella mackenziei CBS 650.93]
MGVREVAELSNSYRTQNLQDTVSGWLHSGAGHEFYSLGKIPEHSWLPTQYKYKKDVDQSSIVSVDDAVSVSDSAHESYSSEASTQTSWTTATDPTDIFLDEDEREQLKCSQASRTSVELQEHLLKGLQTKDPASCVDRSSSKPSQHRLKAHGSTHLQPEVLGPTQKLSQTCIQPRATGTSEVRAQKCNARRSSCSGKTQLSPPKLKRDTDITEQFVSLLIIFATRLVTAIWPLSACPPMMSTCFNGAGVLPLRVFIQETLRRSKTSYSTLQVALYYLILLKARLPSGDHAREEQRVQANGESCERSQCRAMQCGRRMFLSALMLASKYLQDRNYSARAWSKISGLRSNEINENEREYLLQIDYDLHVPKESFDNWSKIVLALSKLSKERPPCRPHSPNVDIFPGSGSSNVLADMVSQVDLCETTGQNTFSDEWWTDIIQKLDPSIVKDSTRADEFLRTSLPVDKFDQLPVLNFNRQPNKPWDSLTTGSEPASHGYDIKFSDTLKSRNVEQCKVQTPQTPVQMSPARYSAGNLPMQPYLRNLPTPQTTPRIADKCQWSSNYNRSLRCFASMDALRSMRKQCIMNANLERCPPPPPQRLPPVKSPIRPAETIRELTGRSATPFLSSPSSVASDSTSCTTRSRSSSISSYSSWSSSSCSMPQFRLRCGGQFSSPLARVCSLSDRYCKSTSADGQQVDVSTNKFHDEGYGSGEELRMKQPKHYFTTSPEVDAVHVLMSLSTQSETSSQSVTPTPQRLAGHGNDATSHINHDSPRGHKRTLSKTDHNLQSQVRNSLLQDQNSFDIVEDRLRPFYDNTPKQWQWPTKTWAAPRRALPNTLDNKRVATYCSIQQFASAPDLASQYLKDAMITAS